MQKENSKDNDIFVEYQGVCGNTNSTKLKQDYIFKKGLHNGKKKNIMQVVNFCI